MTERNSVHDPLEAELGAMRPAELSADFVGRVAEALAAPRRVGPRKAGPHRMLLAGAIGTAVAAGVVVVAHWNRGTPSPAPPVARATVPSPAADEDDRPALGNYRRTLARSPASLDDLLDRHAARPLAGPRQSAGVGGGLLDLTPEH